MHRENGLIYRQTSPRKTIAVQNNLMHLQVHRFISAQKKQRKQTNRKKKKTPQVAAAGKYILIYRNGYAQKYIHIPTVALFLTQGCACL